MSNYIEPSQRDIMNLETAQVYQKQLNNLFRDKRHTNIFFYTGVVLIAIWFNDLDSQSFLLDVMGGTGMMGILLGGFFKYSYHRGEGKKDMERYSEMMNEALAKVKCKWSTKDDKFYVFLEDGRRVELDEY